MRDAYDTLSTEHANPATTRLDRASPLELVHLIVDQDRTVADEDDPAAGRNWRARR